MELDKKTVTYHTITFTDAEAAEIASDLFDKKMGYRGSAISKASSELLNWLGSRNEEQPSGEDAVYDPKTGVAEQW